MKILMVFPSRPALVAWQREQVLGGCDTYLYDAQQAVMVQREGIDASAGIFLRIVDGMDRAHLLRGHRFDLVIEGAPLELSAEVRAKWHAFVQQHLLTR